jgi:hypothetical protein
VRCDGEHLGEGAALDACSGSGHPGQGSVLASVWFTTPPGRARRGYACPHGTGREPGVSGKFLATALPGSGWSTENAASNFEAVEGPVTRKSLVKRKYRRAKRKDVKKATKL